MSAEILQLIGGLGLFLLGMAALTEGLRELAGTALRRILAEFTRTPLRAAGAGAFVTAVVQSSSATTVTTVGFVGAGLLTFTQGVGIVFGANLGTTITGWMVALLGFKLQLGLAVLPLVLVGALLRLFGRGRLRHLGWALAGFALLFLGLDAMQQGMAPLQGLVTPADLPDDSLFGRLQLILIGAVITAITQSSSAGVAFALVALTSGTISFAQGASLVIGMNLGTTVTALLATLGGSTAMRRTGFAHLIFNLITAVFAFFLLTPFADLVAPRIVAGGGEEIALVAFHTLFNLLGIALILPFAEPFARFVAGLVPERGPALLRRLDERLLPEPAAAVDAAAATVRAISENLLRILAEPLHPSGSKRHMSLPLAAVDEALETTRSFVDRIQIGPDSTNALQRYLATVHALDHLLRLSKRCAQYERIETLGSEHRLRRLAGVLRRSCELALDAQGEAATEARFNRLRHLLRDQRESYRERMLRAAASQRLGTQSTLYRLDSIRWLHRVAYHLWRIQHHLARAEQQAPPPETLPIAEELETD